MSRSALIFPKYITLNLIALYILFHDATALADVPLEGAILANRLRTAMKLSKASAGNITTAYEACQNWEEIFEIPAEDIVWPDRKVEALSSALYASCLVRIGDDVKAVRYFTEALSTDPQNVNWRISKAQSLQRLLRYKEAQNEFESTSTAQGALGASTCALRRGEMLRARDIMRSFLDLNRETQESENQEERETYRMLWALLSVVDYLYTGKLSTETFDPLQRCSQSPLYRWIEAVLDPTTSVKKDSPLPPNNVHDAFFSLLKINLSPLDDPNLEILDDKVFLHQLLSVQDASRSDSDFWPKGMILCGEKNGLRDFITDNSKNSDCDSLWLLKRRSGYGSHGNQIYTTTALLENSSEVLEEISTTEDEVLLQQMVDPLLLVDGRKFSLRVYVLYFSPTEIYLSSHGLVKMAALPVLDTDQTYSRTVNPRIHMTNSGRETSMEQWTLEAFKAYLQESGYDVKALETSLQDSIYKLFDAFNTACQENEARVPEKDESYNLLKKLGIPKILGLDYVIDENLNCWLLEVNRFPGLEPRDASDRRVKYRVIEESWKIAGDRLNLHPHPLRHFFEIENDIQAKIGNPSFYRLL